RRRRAPTGARRDASFSASDPWEGLQREMIATGPGAGDRDPAHLGDHRSSPELLPRVDLGHVHLDDGQAASLDRVAHGIGVVRPRAGVHDDRAESLAGRVVAPPDELALVIGLPPDHAVAELRRALLDPFHDLRERLGAVAL